MKLIPKVQNGLGIEILFEDVIKKLGFESNTTDFVGHAFALYTNDNFLEKKTITTIDKKQLYFNSFDRYGNSPFIFPIRD